MLVLENNKRVSLVTIASSFEDSNNAFHLHVASYWMRWNSHSSQLLQRKNTHYETKA